MLSLSGHATEQIRRFDLVELVREGHRLTAVDNLCERLLPGPSTPDKQKLAGQLRRWMEAPSSRTLSGSLTARLKRLSYRDKSQPYPVPTLIMTGARDSFMPVPRQSGPENVVRQVINGAGHLVNLEAPAEVNRHLLNFLQNLSSIKLHHHRLQKVA